MIKLTTTWEDFNSKMLEFIEELDQLIVKEIPDSKVEYDEIKSKLDIWRKHVMAYLKNSFMGFDFYSGLLYDDIKIYSLEFSSFSEDFARVQIGHYPELLQWMNFLHSGIVRILDMLRVSDVIHENLDFFFNIRNDYSTEEILNLTLIKLYNLYNSRFYPIDILLITNGININAERECQEYIDVLKERNLVNQFTIVKQKSIRLTIKGKMYVENLRKKSASDYSSVSNDKDQLFEKLDEILDQAQKANLGNEILFEEMEELKFAYDKLNKKNWGQLFKGKLFDLLIKQVINEDLAKRIFEEVVNMPLYLK